MMCFLAVVKWETSSLLKMVLSDHYFDTIQILTSLACNVKVYLYHDSWHIFSKFGKENDIIIRLKHRKIWADRLKIALKRGVIYARDDPFFASLLVN